MASGKNGARLIQRPKTKASNGTISIDDTVINALKEWRAQQNNILKRFGHIASIDQLVFSQDEDNSLLHSRTPLTWLQVFYQHHPNMKKITVHGFRHTHASLLFEAGADMKQAQDRLRHTNIKIPISMLHKKEKMKRPHSLMILWQMVSVWVKQKPPLTKSGG